MGGTLSFELPANFQIWKVKQVLYFSLSPNPLSRYYPAHAPIMIDAEIWREIVELFPQVFRTDPPWITSFSIS
jgi:hypothetical protein